MSTEPRTKNTFTKDGNRFSTNKIFNMEKASNVSASKIAPQIKILYGVDIIIKFNLNLLNDKRVTLIKVQFVGCDKR